MDKTLAGPRSRPDLVYLEWYCTRLAAEILGPYAVAWTDLWRRCLRIRRFDRQVTGTGIRRIHQEGLCQALGRPPTANYEIFDLTRASPTPARFVVFSAHSP